MRVFWSVFAVSHVRVSARSRALRVACVCLCAFVRGRACPARLCTCFRVHVCACVCANSSPSQIYSADVVELCRALENLLRVVHVGPHDKLKIWELVVWRDVLAAFGLVPKPGLCASKPTLPRIFHTKILEDARVSGGPFDGLLRFEMWDLWWWFDADRWRAAIERYRKGSGIIRPGFLHQMGVAPLRPLAHPTGRRPPRVPASRAAPRARASGTAEPLLLPDLPAWLSLARTGPLPTDSLRLVVRRHLVRWVLLNLKLNRLENKRAGTCSFSYFVTGAGGAIYKPR